MNPAIIATLALGLYVLLAYAEEDNPLVRRVEECQAQKIICEPRVNELHAFWH